MTHLSQTNLDLTRSLQTMRDYFAAPDCPCTDAPEHADTLDRLIRRIRGTRKQNRPYGQLKALVASTPKGGVLEALDNSHAASLRVAAKGFRRRVRVARVAPGKPTRTVTLLN